jgi:hypothetical protein
MDDLDALARQLRHELPPVPEELQGRQLQRLLLDPGARIARPRRASPAAWVLVSAVVCALALMLWVLPRASAPCVTASVSLTAATTELRHQLPDGSVIRLRPGALGKLQDSGAAGVRFELERGRGDFSVTLGRERVFTVKAGKYEVQVLGTEFSVSYESAGLISVAVTRGLVSVRDGVRPALQLAAGDRMTGGDGELEIVRAVANRDASAVATLAAPNLDGAPSSGPEHRAASPSAPVPAPGWRELYQRGDYRAAVAAARTAGLSGLVERLGAADLADLADAARLGGDLPAALMALRALERRFPRAAPAQAAGFLIGRVLTQTGQRSEATAAFERYLALEPNGIYSLEAMGRLMELYGPSDNAGRARILADHYLERAPSGPYQRLARSLATRR